MIIAGIDEAGLGPRLGPLCVVSVALRAPDGWEPATPWQALAAAVADKPGRAEKRIVVADSKIVFAGRSLAALERPTLAFFSASPLAAPLPMARQKFLAILGAYEALENIAHCPWDEQEWQVPAFCAPAALAEDAADLAKAMSAAGAAIVGLQARVTLAKVFNQRIANGNNKADALWLDTVSHLRWLVTYFPDEEVVVSVDKQGGRNRYLPLLAAAFSGCVWQKAVEGAMLSAYSLRRNGPLLRVAFMPRAEQMSFATALASIVAKYLRERFMAALNGFFLARIPGLPPTAGYPADAPRFISAVRPILTEIGVAEEGLVRCR